MIKEKSMKLAAISRS